MDLTASGIAKLARTLAIACFASSFFIFAMTAHFLITHSRVGVDAVATIGLVAYLTSSTGAVLLIVIAVVKRAPKTEFLPALRWLVAGYGSFVVQAFVAHQLLSLYGA